MNELNPELQAQVHRLAEICCHRLSHNEGDYHDEANAIVRALVVGGYDRISDINLQVRVETIASDICSEIALHHRAELSKIAGDYQAKFRNSVTWQTRTPDNDPEPSKPANISSSTNS